MGLKESIITEVMSANGKKGGEETLARHGKSHFQKIRSEGKEKARATLLEKYGTDFFINRARKAGLAAAQKRRAKKTENST